MGRVEAEWSLSHFLQFYLNYVLTLSSHEWIQGKVEYYRNLSLLHGPATGKLPDSSVS